MSARKIGFLILILAFGGIVETAWHVRENHFAFGPEGFRVLGGRFYGPSFTFEESAERVVEADPALEIEVRNSFGGVRIVPGPGPTIGYHPRSAPRLDSRLVALEDTVPRADVAASMAWICSAFPAPSR